jgi:hypothetical protein
MGADANAPGRQKPAFFRRCRIALWLLLLTGLVGAVYLNLIGLPEFVKVRLLAQLRARGVELRFERMRLRFHRGIVAEHVTLGSAARPDAPELQIGEVALKLNYRALWRRRLQVDALGIHAGRLVLPLGQSPEGMSQLALENISAAVRFPANDCLEIDEFQASLLGMRLRLSASISSASALRQWRQPGGVTDQRLVASVWQAQARQFVQACKQVRFVSPPDVRLVFRGDARAPASFVGQLNCQALGAQTPWGTAAELQLTAHLNESPPTNGWFTTAVKVNLDDTRSQWGRLQHGRLSLKALQSATNSVPSQVDWELALSGLETRPVNIQTARAKGRSLPAPRGPPHWQTELTVASSGLEAAALQARSGQLSGRLVHCLTNLLPAEALANVRFAEVRSSWGAIREARLTNLVFQSSTAVSQAQPAWAGGAKLAPYELAGAACLDRATSTNVEIQRITAQWRWAAPLLTVSDLHADLYGGRFDASQVRLETAVRALEAQLELAFDVRRLAALLTPDAQRWLAQFDWQEPPQVNGHLRFTWPEPTSASSDWRAEVLPRIWLKGRLRGENGAFRGVRVSRVQSSFSLSNAVWQLPDLVVARPEGTAELAYTGNLLTRDFHWRLRTRLDPKAVRPLLEPAAQRGLDFFDFTEPPLIEGEVAGRWFAPELTGLAAQVTATNFTFRGERCDRLRAWVSFTNSFLVSTQAEAWHAQEWVRVASLGLNTTNYWLWLTNAQSMMDPMRIGRAIGPQVAEAIKPYCFRKPPRAVVEGRVLTRGQMPPADLLFQIAGGPFSYWRFNVPHIQGQVHWQTNKVSLRGVEVPDFYNGPRTRGRLTGDLGLLFHPEGDAELQFQAQVAEADLHRLLADLGSPTNRLEGTISGQLHITQANTADWQSWNGLGQVTMREGLLWDIPLFGVFSPLLNSIVPGLGSSRAKAAKATHTIQQSVIHTKDLEIQSPPVRLHYEGTVDFQGNVKARVTAEILRGAPLVGPLVSLALSPLSKVFEYRVTGTLANPKTEPVYIPKFIDSLLHPLRTLRGLFTSPPGPPASGESPGEDQR